MISHATDNISHHSNYKILKSMLKVFSVLLDMFDYKQCDKCTNLVGVWIKCDTCKRDMYCNINNKEVKDMISILIKTVCFSMLVFLV